MEGIRKSIFHFFYLISNWIHLSNSAVKAVIEIDTPGHFSGSLSLSTKSLYHAKIYALQKKTGVRLRDLGAEGSKYNCLAEHVLTCKTVNCYYESNGDRV